MWPRRLASAIAAQERYEEAEPLYLASYSTFDAGDTPRYRAAAEEVREELVRFYAAWGRPEQAAAWEAPLPATDAPPP